MSDQIRRRGLDGFFGGKLGPGIEGEAALGPVQCIEYHRFALGAGRGGVEEMAEEEEKIAGISAVLQGQSAGGTFGLHGLE